MATVNFSVPDEVQAAFDETFKNQDQNAIIADLMRKAVERIQHPEPETDAVEQILALRAQTPPVPAGAIQAARQELRQ
ncbi:hypothetical protein [Methylomagnum sp.]